MTGLESTLKIQSHMSVFVALLVDLLSLTDVEVSYLHNEVLGLTMIAFGLVLEFEKVKLLLMLCVYL